MEMNEDYEDVNDEEIDENVEAEDSSVVRQKEVVEKLPSAAELQTALASENIEVIYNALYIFGQVNFRIMRGQSDPVYSDDAKLLIAFTKLSPNLQEVFKLWHYQQEKNVTRIEIVVVDVLYRIIPATSHCDLHAVTSSVVRKILRNHMKAVHRNLSSNRPQLIQSTLRMLIAIVSHSSSSAKELLNVLNLTMKPFQKFLTMRKSKSDDGSSPRRYVEDVRSLYIRFILSFFVHKDPGLKRTVLEIKDFVVQIFKGMKEDSYENVVHILSSLTRHVIDDNDLNKSVKVTFFNNNVLDQIAKLYQRNNPKVDISSLPKPESHIRTIAEVVHKFFLNLTASSDAALSFVDSGWFPPSKTPNEGKGPKVYNKILQRFITSTLKPMEDEKQQDLLMAILENNPELTHSFWTTVSSMSYDPRPSPKWLQNMALAAKIIALPVPSPLMGAACASSSPYAEPFPTCPPPPIKIVADNIIPSPLTRLFLGKALQHTDALVKYTAISVMSFSFCKLSKIKQIFSLSISAFVDEENQSSLKRLWVRANDELLEEIRRRVPDLQIVVALVQSLAKATETKEDKVNSDSDVNTSTLYAGALKLARWYQFLFPEMLIEAKFDVGKFLVKDFLVNVEKSLTKSNEAGVNGTSLEEQLDVEINVLQLLQEATGLKWWNKSNGARLSYLGTVLSLNLITNGIRQRSTDVGDCVRLMTLSRKVLVNHLEPSILFGHFRHRTQIEIFIDSVLSNYMNCIPNTRNSIDAITTFVEWIDDSLCEGAKNASKTLEKSQIFAGDGVRFDELNIRLDAHTEQSRQWVLDLFGTLENSIADGGVPVPTLLIALGDGFVSKVKKWRKSSAIGKRKRDGDESRRKFAKLDSGKEEPETEESGFSETDGFVVVLRALQFLTHFVVSIMRQTQNRSRPLILFVDNIKRALLELEDFQKMKDAQCSELLTQLQSLESYLKRFGFEDAKDVEMKERVLSDTVDWKLFKREIKSGVRPLYLLEKVAPSNLAQYFNKVLNLISDATPDSQQRFVLDMAFYLSSRHPYCGSIFTIYSEFEEYMISGSESIVITDIMNQLSFDMLFSNIILYLEKYPEVETVTKMLTILNDSATNENQDPKTIVFSVHHVVLEISRTLQNDLTNKMILNVFFATLMNLMKYASECSQKLASHAHISSDSKIYDKIYTRSDGFPEDSDFYDVQREKSGKMNLYEVVIGIVFGHPCFANHYLTDKNDLIASYVNNLVHQFAKDDVCKSSNLAHVWTPYKEKVMQSLLKTQAVSNGADAALSYTCELMSESELDEILAAYLDSIKIRASDFTQHSKVIAMILNSPTRKNNRMIPIDSFEKILSIVSYPNEKSDNSGLDIILLAALQTCCIPPPHLGASRLRVVSYESKFDNSGFVDVRNLISEIHFTSLLSNLNFIKVEIVRLLCDSSRYHQKWLRNWVAKEMKLKRPSEWLRNAALLDALLQEYSRRSRSTDSDDLLHFIFENSKETYFRIATERISGLAEDGIGDIGDQTKTDVAYLNARHHLLEPSIMERFFSLGLVGSEAMLSFLNSMANTIFEKLTADNSRLAVRWLIEYSPMLREAIKEKHYTNVQANGKAVSWSWLIKLGVLRAYFVCMGRQKQLENSNENLRSDDTTVFEKEYIYDILKEFEGEINEIRGSKDRSLVTSKTMLWIGTSPKDSPSLQKFTFKSFLVTAMRFRLDDAHVLRFLSTLLGFCFDLSKHNTEISSLLPFSASVLVDMIYSHSRFNQITKIPSESQKTQRQQAESHPAKANMLRLLLFLIQIDPVHCCKPEHLQSLAVAYRGTTSDDDRETIKILSLYESQAGISVAKSLIGYWSHEGRASSTALESLGKIDASWMLTTCENFGYFDIFEHTRNCLQSSQHKNVYDLEFHTSLAATAAEELLGHNLDSTAADPRKLVESNIIGLCVMGLSSQNKIIRRTSSYVVEQIYVLINKSSDAFKDKNQILVLLDSFRNAIVCEDDTLPRIPAIISIFVAHSISILLKPESNMYPIVNRFLLQRAHMDLEDIPLFYELFFSSSSEARRERVWMLRLLLNGLSDFSDYKLYKRRHVFDILTGLFNSPLADQMSRKLILEILYKSVSIPQVLWEIMSHSGFLSFLNLTVSTMDFTPQNEITLGFGRLLFRTIESWLWWLQAEKTDGQFRLASAVIESWIEAFASIAEEFTRGLSSEVIKNAALVVKNGTSLESSVRHKAANWNFNVMVDILNVYEKLCECSDLIARNTLSSHALCKAELVNVFGLIEKDLDLKQTNESGSSESINYLDISAVWKVLNCDRGCVLRAQIKLLDIMGRSLCWLNRHELLQCVLWSVPLIETEKQFWDSKNQAAILKWATGLLRIQRNSPNQLLSVLCDRAAGETLFARIIHIWMLLAQREVGVLVACCANMILITRDALRIIKGAEVEMDERWRASLKDRFERKEVSDVCRVQIPKMLESVGFSDEALARISNGENVSVDSAEDLFALLSALRTIWG
ncbi:hypothetical protein HK098_001168 [Nowakowskiella sp. JEL0407]|nr:hypothetical protein HK098_001168 [Nowakowskiella sp. JEL0407]